MTARYRRALHIGLAVLAVWLAYQGLQYFRITHPNRNHAMTESLKETQSFCVGRFLIDLPKGTTILKTNGSGGAADYHARYPVSKAEFERQVEERWTALQAKKADPFGTPYVEPTKRTSPMEDAVLFAFEHVILDGPDVQGVVRERPFHYTEAYLWRDSILYSFSNKSSDEAIIATMQTIQTWQHDQIPSESGFCGPRSFFPGGAKPEDIWIAFRLPTQPAMELRLSTAMVGEPIEGIGGPQIPPHPNLKAYESDTFKVKIYRDANRTVAGLAGKESLEGSTEYKFERYNTGISAEWYFPGEIDASGKPYIRAQFDISFDTAEPPSPWAGFPPKQSPDDIGEEEFMAYWDTIMNSLRLRPGALPPGNK